MTLLTELLRLIGTKMIADRIGTLGSYVTIDNSRYKIVIRIEDSITKKEV